MKTYLAGVVGAAILVAGSVAASPYRDRGVPMSVVSNLDIERYMGRWDEIARFPNSFEKGCTAVTADYALKAGGTVSVVNTCREGAPDGPVRAAEGVARLEAPGRLSVSFVPWLPFTRGDYWVIAIDVDYSVAVVGTPCGRTGWILARAPEVPAAAREQAEAALRRNGYDTTQLIDVVHDWAARCGIHGTESASNVFFR